MNEARLLGGILETGPWLDRFRKRSYPDAFREYCETYGPLYEEALEETEPERLAESLLDRLAEHWRHCRPWNRTVLRLDVQQMLVAYLSPMLLAMKEECPGCGALEEAFRRGWGVRWPREAYQAAEFAALQKGFRNTFMGIALGDSRDTP